MLVGTSCGFAGAMSCPQESALPAFPKGKIKMASRPAERRGGYPRVEVEGGGNKQGGVATRAGRLPRCCIGPVDADEVSSAGTAHTPPLFCFCCASLSSGFRRQLTRWPLPLDRAHA